MKKTTSITAFERENFISALAVAFPISDTRYALLRGKVKSILAGMNPANRRQSMSTVACMFRSEYEAEQVWEPASVNGVIKKCGKSRRKNAVAAKRATVYPPAERIQAKVS